MKPIEKIKKIKRASIHVENQTDHSPKKLPHTKAPNSEIEFVQGRILYKGQAINQVIRELQASKPEALATLAAALEEFKEHCLKNRKRSGLSAVWRTKKRSYSSEELAQIFAICDALIKKISDVIKKRFDQTQDGLHIVFDEDGQLILNGINVQALITQCEAHATPKSLLFLKGMRQRLELVLHHKTNNPNYERLEEIVIRLFEKMDQVLNLKV